MTHFRDTGRPFDTEEFEKEIQYIFEQVYSSYLNHELELIEQVCFGEALGYFKSLIES